MEDICAICLDKKTWRTVTLECGHNFHHRCIKKWVNIKNQCPLCRLPLKHIYKVYLVENKRLKDYQLEIKKYSFILKSKKNSREYVCFYRNLKNIVKSKNFVIFNVYDGITRQFIKFKLNPKHLREKEYIISTVTHYINELLNASRQC